MDNPSDTAMKPENKLKLSHAEFGESPDVKFVFHLNGGAMIFAEKHILARRSEVFEKQFDFSDDRECVGESSERIAIKDISFDAFYEMIKHIYGNTIDIYEGNYLELLYASRKYFVNDLTYQIIKFVEGFINPENLADNFEFIDKFDIKMLNDHMRRICTESPLTVIQTLSTTEPHLRILAMILESPSLPCPEFQLYKAIVNMMKSDAKNSMQSGERMRKSLGKLIYLIRFPTMSVKELVECGKQPSLLTHKEIVEFLLWVQEKIFTDSLQFYSIAPRGKVDDTKPMPPRVLEFNRVSFLENSYIDE